MVADTSFRTEVLDILVEEGVTLSYLEVDMADELPPFDAPDWNIGDITDWLMNNKVSVNSLHVMGGGYPLIWLGFQMFIRDVSPLRVITVTHMYPVSVTWRSEDFKDNNQLEREQVGDLTTPIVGAIVEGIMKADATDEEDLALCREGWMIDRSLSLLAATTMLACNVNGLVMNGVEKVTVSSGQVRKHGWRLIWLQKLVVECNTYRELAMFPWRMMSGCKTLTLDIQSSVGGKYKASVNIATLVGLGTRFPAVKCLVLLTESTVWVHEVHVCSIE